MAPMAGITDSPFRQMCRKYGADVMYSEMASATALFYDSKARKDSLSPTLELLKFEEIERPYVVQLFGSKPEHFSVAARIVEEKIKPDGIDINFGCPVKKVQKQGAGAVLMSDLKLSRQVIKHTIQHTNLPVSVKTRTQAGEADVLRFLDNISDLDVKALMLHGRTLKQLFSGPIDTAIIKKARDYFGGIIIANGGIGTSDAKHKNVRDEAERILEEVECDGLGIGRGAMGRPWIFKCLRTGQSTSRSAAPIKKEIMTHVDLIIKQKGEAGLIEFRKHLAWYVQGCPGARKIRQQLVQINSKKDISRILKDL